jgi:multidrug efflux pump subunit AcrB
LTTDEVQKRVAALLPKDIPGIRFKSGYSRGSSATGVGVEIKGRSQEILNMLAEDVELNMQGLSGVHDVESSLESGTEEIRVVVDRKRAQRLGLSPRLMTATTTILGLAPLVLPMIYGQAEGNARRWGPIGLVVISGLFASTLMTLILLPTVYSLMDDLSTWIRRFVAMARTSSTRATS